ncbi:hypothetical protein Fot_02540 [Forsythia ovata]|uniref:Uncharacterized protein n=1 Tax=Forsythia ovata TaxID=205694 RepID=A0ABD1X764_9LAMI
MVTDILILGKLMRDQVERLKRVLKLCNHLDEGRHSRACLARNMELMAAQMLEIQRQQTAQIAVLNAYLQHGFVPPASPIYPLYQPGVYVNYYVNKEEQVTIHTPHQPIKKSSFEEMKWWIHSSTKIRGTTWRKIM